jgi:hypothetical protein
MQLPKVEFPSILAMRKLLFLMGLACVATASENCKAPPSQSTVPKRDGSVEVPSSSVDLGSGATSQASGPNAVVGYKGIPWGTECTAAVAKLKADGTTVYLRGTVGRSPLGFQFFFVDPAFGYSCEPRYSDQELPGFHPSRGTHDDGYAYEIYSTGEDKGGIALTLFCRLGAFVGVTLSAANDGYSEDAARALRTAAGKRLKSRNWKWEVLGQMMHAQDWYLLEPSSDATRLLSEDKYHPGFIPSVQYHVFSKNEQLAIEKAGTACASMLKAKEDEEQARRSKIVQ